MTQMKKITWMMLMALTLGACSSKDEPIQPKPTPKTEKTEQPSTDKPQGSKPNSSEDDDKKPEGDQPKAPEDAKEPANNDPAKDEPGQDEGQPNDPDQSGNQSDDTTGQQKPSEDQKDLDKTTKGLRAKAQWRDSESVIYKDATLEEVLLGSKDISTMSETIKQYLTFTSSSHDGKPYSFTGQEVNDLKIVDLKISERSTSSRTISFRIDYNGVKSTDQISLPLNMTEYYTSKVTINATEAGKYYLGGIAHNIGVFYSRFLEYNTEKYALSVDGNQPDEHNQSLSLQLTIKKHGSDETLATLTKTLTGFRPLSNLNGSLQSSPSHDLVIELKGKVNGYKAMLKERLNLGIQNWIKKANFSIKGKSGEIVWSDGNLVGDNDVRDIYLKNPKFEVVSAERKDNKLELKIKLTNASDVQVGALLSLSIDL